MLSCLNVIFYEAKGSDTQLLGRKAQDYLFREFHSCEQVIVKEGEETNYFSDEAVNVVLPLNMPLVLVEDISHVIENMRRKKILSMRLGSKATSARICIGKDETGSFFATGDAFLQLGGTKSVQMVYTRMKERILNRHLDNDVEILDFATVHIDDTVLICSSAKVLPFSRICGESVLRSGAIVSASYIEESTLEENTTVQYSHIVSSRVRVCASVGPFARLRGADIGEECRIGDFVEIKASILHNKVKSAHLCYIGDAEVGELTNVGCGTVFCNYDGVSKHKTEVGENCFIGANTNIIAPLTIGNNAFIAAGTTVNENIESDTFTIGRTRQQTRKK